jgi:hypothetical protein
MNEFDTWRKNYDSMTIQQQVEYHNELEAKYPEQAHFNYENVKILLDMSKKNLSVLEFEAPLSENGQNWNGYFGTYKLNFGWSQVIEIMANNGFEVVHHLNQGKIFKTI